MTISVLLGSHLSVSQCFGEAVGFRGLRSGWGKRSGAGHFGGGCDQNSASAMSSFLQKHFGRALAAQLG